jgi:hypothetical protein
MRKRLRCSFPEQARHLDTKCSQMRRPLLRPMGLPAKAVEIE